MLPMNWRRLARIFFRIVIPAAIIAVVGWQFVLILRRPELRDFEFACRVEWLIPAAFLYLGCHSIWASFWVSLLRSQGFHASYPTGLRAYFVSQWGKYVPGKVWVIVIRVMMLGATTKDKAIVGVTATYEAVTSMAAGAILGAILLPMLAIEVLSIKGQAYILIGIACIPIGIGLLHRLIVRIARRKMGPDAPPLPNMNLLLLVRGLFQASVGWCLLGLSVWMVMQAVRPQPVALTFDEWLRATAINCLSYTLGFIVMVAPAGGGVREWVLKELLPREFAGVPEAVALGLAVITALLVRLIWTLAEFILMAILYKLVPGAQSPPLAPMVEELTS
jgi:hypothetical protein